jgi:methionyl-tRNA synthetase
MGVMNKYICTAIPYVNGDPHIGNALDYLLADVWTRWQKSRGVEVRFQIGTDEHGNKIAAKAESLGLTPKEYVDGQYGKFKEMASLLGASWTDFIRTSDPAHEARVQEIWKKLSPYIYKGEYKGWYCQGCEAFFSEKEAKACGYFCPDHQKDLTEVSEENYFLRVSDFTDAVRDAITKKELEIVPDWRAKEFLNLIKDGMPDVSISRPRRSLSWGVAVPDDPDQVIYVWIDALSNYITVLGYPSDDGSAAGDFNDFWPADLQVVGKDILRFHAGIWPVILMGLGLALPKKILVHGYITVNGGEKMSKSVGNVVDPFKIISDFGVDAFRYFFVRHIPTLDDGDFSDEKFLSAYNNELANELGNLVSRVAAMCQKYEVLGDLTDESLRATFLEYSGFETTRFDDLMEACKFSESLDYVWKLVQGANRFVEDNKPWVLAREGDNDKLTEVLQTLVAGLLTIAEYLSIFMPATAAKMREIYDISGAISSVDVPLFAKKIISA